MTWPAKPCPSCLIHTVKMALQLSCRPRASFQHPALGPGRPPASQSSVPSVNQDCGCRSLVKKRRPSTARPLLPVRDDIASAGIVEITAHDREAIGVSPHRLDRQLVRIRVLQHRVDQGAVDAGGLLGRDRLLGQVGLLAMMGGRRALSSRSRSGHRMMIIGASCFGFVSACCRFALYPSADRAQHLRRNTQRIAWLSAASALRAGASPL